MAATLTKISLKNGLSQTEWVEKNEQLLRALQFQYLEGNVFEEEGTDETASATVRVRLFVVTGEVRQAERYSLKKVDKHWLIDTRKFGMNE